MGREDIDVRCLGLGRPFVLELKAPEKRASERPFEELINAVNLHAGGKVEVVGPMRLSTRAEPARLKSAVAQKTYTIRFKVDGAPLGEEEKIKMLSLAGVTLEQRTPSRVEHRRADLVRQRKVFEVTVQDMTETEAALTIRAESGTYIKELVHSDEGRTTPSVAGLIGRTCTVLWLDVEEIHAD